MIRTEIRFTPLGNTWCLHIRKNKFNKNTVVTVSIEVRLCSLVHSNFSNPIEIMSTRGNFPIFSAPNGRSTCSFEIPNFLWIDHYHDYLGTAWDLITYIRLGRYGNECVWQRLMLGQQSRWQNPFVFPNSANIQKLMYSHVSLWDSPSESHSGCLTVNYPFSFLDGIINLKSPRSILHLKVCSSMLLDYSIVYIERIENGGLSKGNICFIWN